VSEQITTVTTDEETKRRIKVLAALDNVSMPEELHKIIEQEWQCRNLQGNDLSAAAQTSQKGKRQ